MQNKTKKQQLQNSKKIQKSKTKIIVCLLQKFKKSKSDDIVFIKQVPVHPRDRLKTLAASEEKVEFIKQVPVHSRDRLKKLATAAEKVEFIKQVPVNPRGRIKNKEGQIARDNVSKLTGGNKKNK